MRMLMVLLLATTLAACTFVVPEYRFYAPEKGLPFPVLGCEYILCMA